MPVSDNDWRQAADDAGRFLDQLRSLAVEFQWSPAGLFDVPRDGRPVFDRVPRAEWINPYAKGAH